jgi:uncharacterized membrane protein YwzB
MKHKIQLFRIIHLFKNNKQTILIQDFVTIIINSHLAHIMVQLEKSSKNLITLAVQWDIPRF